MSDQSKGRRSPPKKAPAGKRGAKTRTGRADTAAISGKKPPKVPQPHGGALYTGGVAGNRGGPGRPPAELREALREAAAARVAVYTDMADGIVKVPLQHACEHCGRVPSGAPKVGDVLELAVSASDRRGAMDSMLRFGLGEQREILEAGDVRLKLAATRDTIRTFPHLSGEHADALLKQIAKHWE